jgi:hypothetical protein
MQTNATTSQDAQTESLLKLVDASRLNLVLLRHGQAGSDGVGLMRRTHKPGQLVAIIAHNGLNGMLLAEMVGLVYRRSIFFHSSHTGVTVANVSLTAPTISLRLMGCTRHLPPKMVSG